MGFFDLFSGGDSERAVQGEGAAGGELAEGGVEGAGSASKFSNAGTIPPVAAAAAAGGEAGAAASGGKTASQRAYADEQGEHLATESGPEGPVTPPKLKAQGLADDPGRPARHAAMVQQFAVDDPTHANFRESTSSSVSTPDVFQAITSVNPGLPHTVRAMMTGHSFGEQNGKNVGNFNYMGMEPYLFDPPSDPKRLWTRANRSGQITLSMFEANPDLFIDWPGGGFGTISEQIAKGKKTDIFCMWPGPRIVYSSLEEASRSFYSGIINWRLHSLQKSDNPDHKAIADGVMSGDVEAYIKMVTLTDKSIGIAAYNGNAVYPGLIRPHLNAALADAKLNALP